MREYLTADHEKVTPKYDLSWYVKWSATFIGMVGIVFTTFNIFPFNIFLMLISASMWSLVAYMWKDRALFLVNAFAILFAIIGIINIMSSNDNIQREIREAEAFDARTICSI